MTPRAAAAALAPPHSRGAHRRRSNGSHAEDLFVCGVAAHTTSVAVSPRRKVPSPPVAVPPSDQRWCGVHRIHVGVAAEPLPFWRELLAASSLPIEPVTGLRVAGFAAGRCAPIPSPSLAIGSRHGPHSLTSNQMDEQAIAPRSAPIVRNPHPPRPQSASRASPLVPQVAAVDHPDLLSELHVSGMAAVPPAFRDGVVLLTGRPTRGRDKAIRQRPFSARRSSRDSSTSQGSGPFWLDLPGFRFSLENTMRPDRHALQRFSDGTPRGSRAEALTEPDPASSAMHPHVAAAMSYASSALAGAQTATRSVVMPDRTRFASGLRPCPMSPEATVALVAMGTRNVLVFPPHTVAVQ